MTLTPKLSGHKLRCPRCKTADSITDLCRVGRRLFLGWFTTLDHDSQMFAFLAMPEDERERVKNLVDIHREVVFGSKLQ